MAQAVSAGATISTRGRWSGSEKRTARRFSARARVSGSTQASTSIARNPATSLGSGSGTEFMVRFEASPALVSLFEPHADIIVKGARDVQYGPKLNLVTGKSGLIVDIVIESGNPAGAEHFLPMLDRHIARCGTRPGISRRRRLCQPRQSHRGHSAQRHRCRLPQQARPGGRGHDQKRLGLSQAAQLPGRDRGRHLCFKRA
jgi:hypothetical protein